MEFRFASIGTVRSCFPEKFGIPRQPGLVPEARARIDIDPAYDAALDGLEQATHAWVVFVFSEAKFESDRLTVRPPRLGGKARLGIFATRTPHRPNPIGISACKIEKITRDPKQPAIELSGVDLLDGTPVLDIKPYVPYADSIPEARCDWARDAGDETLVVEFTSEAAHAVALAETRHRGATELIRKLVALDPRPAHQSGDAQYSMRVLDIDVHWEIQGNTARIHRVDPEKK